MNVGSRLRGEVLHWLNNGANVITLLRLPMLAGVMAGVLMLAGALPRYGATPLVIFWVTAILQAIGMITDGIDGWFARNHSKVGPTPEGQFLDQFVDKIFVWMTWWLLSLVFHQSGVFALDQLHALAWWWLPSFLLFGLDLKSCRKHWINYRKDRGKPVNRSHGAVWQGKWKFVMENVVVCVLLGTMAPRLTSGTSFGHQLHGCFVITADFLSAFVPVYLFIAIGLACSSLMSRARRTKQEESPPTRFAEAVTDDHESA